METIIPVDVQVKLDETQALATTYEGYIVNSSEKYRTSADDLKIIKAKIKELTETRMSLTRPIEESKKKIIALFKVPLDFLIQAEKAVKKALVVWDTEQERIRQVEQDRLAAIQREEAAKLQQQAAKEAVRAAELKTEAAREKAAAKAEELKAEAEATMAVAPTVESKVEQVNGISRRKNWKFKIVDESLIPREYLIPDEKYIGQIVRASHGKKQIAGIEIYSEDIIASR